MQLRTHRVINQAPEIKDINLFESDTPLKSALIREGGSAFLGHLHTFGSEMGAAETWRHGRDANRFPPEAIIFDRYGHRLDRVDFHPSYHHMMRLAMKNGVHSIAWTAEKGGHVAHAAMEYILTQVEAGVCCPITMTYAVVPAIAKDAALKKELMPKLLSTDYDDSFSPIQNKVSMTMGMAMTEKQGGSDVRANTTMAVPVTEREYALTGHKWFCSAPMSDAFLTLAQAPNGLTCFYVPRWKPNGEQNGIYLQRLKDKLGNRSNASSEIEYDNTYARRLGEEGRGVSTIIEMVHHTRLDCSVAATGIMRQAIAQAIHHCRHRCAFGKPLIQQPLMQNVLADMIVEQESALHLVMRVARSYDESAGDAAQAALSRLTVAIAKYWTNKRCSYVVNEAMECLGGAGYVEESILPRLYREAPLNGIWEGSGNVICLDVLRALSKEPHALTIFLDEISTVKGLDTRMDKAILRLHRQISNRDQMMFRARGLVETMALTYQGALLLQSGRSAVVDAFLSTRLGEEGGRAFGTMPNHIDVANIIDGYMT